MSNFKLYKETGGNRFISGFGTLLCFGAAIVLVGYNAIHSPDSLFTSGIIILVVGVFSIIYHKFKKKRGKEVTSLFIDKHLEHDEKNK